jgi:hypothetical protein
MLEGVSDSAELVKRHRDSLERLRAAPLWRQAQAQTAAVIVSA